MSTRRTRSAPDTSQLWQGPAQWPAAVLVLVGLVLSLGSFIMLRTTEFSRAQAEFSAETDQSRAVVQDQLTGIVDSLRSVSALLESSEEVTRAEFRSFTKTILASHPEILSLEWIPRVSASTRNSFEQQARTQGLADYHIKDIAPTRSFVRAASRADHYPIYYIEPFESNREAVGLDYAGRPRRAAALIRARDSGELVAVSGFELLRPSNTSKALNIAIFLPRYSAGPVPSGIEERRARNVGFVVVIFHMRTVLQEVFDQFAPMGIAFEVHEHQSAPGQAAAVHSSMKPAAYGLKREQRLDLPHLQLHLAARATPQFAKRPRYAFAWAALASGLAITGLAFGYMQTLRRQFARRGELELERNRLFNLTPDLLCITGFDGYFRQLSPAWERTLGYSREELMSRHFTAFVHPDDIASSEESFRRLLAGSEVLDLQNRYRRSDGAWRWLEWRAISAPEQNLIYASARDITQQRETYRALEHARRFAERATDVMPGVLYIDDVVEHRNVFINPQGALSLGLPKDYFSPSEPHTVQNLMHEEDVPRYLEHIEHIRTLADGEIAEFTYRMRHADGSWRWFQGRDAVFERDPEGRVRLSIGTATDVTAIKHAEMALRENDRRLDFVLTAANMGVWELDLDTLSVLWTQSLSRLLGAATTEAPRSLDDFLSLLHPDDREEQRRRICEAARGGAMYQSEFRVVSPDQSIRWMTSVARLVQGEAGKGSRLLGLIRDITVRKQAESEQKRMQERVRQAEKMEALGALAGGIAHDFNNILTAINGNARLSLQELPADHPTRVYIEEIQRGAMRATDLVSRILAFSRNEEPALRQVDLGVVVEEAVRLLRATMPAMVSIRFQAEPTPPVLADATQIHQLIMNLGANARDAMSARGGELTISLQVVAVDAQLRALAPEIQGDTCVRVIVEDTGVGIAAEDLDRIFEPFFTTKPPGHGTGMGLAMVHGIVRRHGGVILVTSEPQHGTRVEIYLPIATQRIAPEQTPSRLDHMRGQGERILYVDDEEPLVFLATRMLARMGFQVEGYTDAQQALMEFERDPSRWDLVISDLGMPGMSGLDLATELLRIRPDVPLILTSGYVRLEDAERARRIGAGDIILKPSTVEEMAPLILARLDAARGND